MASAMFCAPEGPSDLDAIFSEPPETETLPTSKESDKPPAGQMAPEAVPDKPEEAPSVQEIIALTNPELLNEADRRARTLFTVTRAFQEGSPEAEHYYQLIEETALVMSENQLHQAFQKDAFILANDYVAALGAIASYYERWFAEPSVADFSELGRFRTSQDGSLLLALQPQEDTSKSNLRYFLFHEALRDPKRYYVNILSMAQAILELEKRWPEYLSEEEKKEFTARRTRRPEQDTNGYYRDLGGLDTWESMRDLYRYELSLRVLTNDSVSDLAEQIRDELPLGSNLGNQTLAVISRAVEKVLTREGQDALLREVESDPRSQQQFNRRRTYTGATELEMAQAKAYAEGVREYPDEFVPEYYFSQILPSHELERRLSIGQSFPGSFGMVKEANTQQGSREFTLFPDLRRSDTRENRIRFLIAADISNPVLARQFNQIVEDDSLLFFYSREELLRLHYIRQWIKDFPIADFEEGTDRINGLWKLEELTALSSRLKQFESLWTSAFLNPPQIQFSSREDFEANFSRIEAMVLGKHQRFPGIPFELLGLGRDIRRRKLFFDQPEAEELNLYHYVLAQQRETNLNHVMPIPEYRWVSTEQFLNEAQILAVDMDTKRAQLVRTLRNRFLNEAGRQWDVFQEAFNRTLNQIQPELTTVNQRIQEIEANEVVAESPLAQELANLISRKQILETRLAEWRQAYEQNTQLRGRVAGYFFEDWDHFQLELLAHLTEPVDGKARFGWDEPIFQDDSQTTLFALVLGMNPQNPVEAMRFSSLKNLVAEYAVYRRLYGQNPRVAMETEMHGDSGVAQFLYRTQEERRAMIEALVEDQRFSALFSAGGRAREDGSGVRFFTPVHVRAIEEVRQETLRLLRSKGIPVVLRDETSGRDENGELRDPRQRAIEARVDTLFADAAEIIARSEQNRQLDSRSEQEKQAFYLQRLVKAEAQSFLDLLGVRFLSLLGGDGRLADFRSRFPVLVGNQRASFLEQFSKDMVKAMQEEAFDYDLFVERFGQLNFLLQTLAFDEEVNKTRVQVEIKAIAQSLIDQLKSSKSLSASPLLVVLTALRDSERQGYVIVWEDQTMRDEFGAPFTARMPVERPATRPLDLQAIFSQNQVLKGLYFETQEEFVEAVDESNLPVSQRISEERPRHENPLERLRAIYTWTEEHYLSQERELLVTQDLRRHMQIEQNQAIQRYQASIGFTQSPRDRTQVGGEDPQNLEAGEQAAMGRVSMTVQGAIGLLYKDIRFISQDAVLSNAFQDYSDTWQRLRPDLDLRTWFFLSPQTREVRRGFYGPDYQVLPLPADQERMAIKGDSKGYLQRLLRFMGVFSDDPRRVPGRRDQIQRNASAEELVVKILNQETWDINRTTMIRLATEFFESGKALYEAIDQRNGLSREHITQIIERQFLDPEGFGKLLTQTEVVFFSSRGGRVSGEEAEKILNEVGLLQWYRGLNSSGKSEVRRQLGLLRRFTTSTQLMFRGDAPGDVAIVDVMGQLLAPAVLKEIFLGEGATVSAELSAFASEAELEGVESRAHEARRVDIIRARLSHIPQVFGDESPEAIRRFEALAEDLDRLSNADLEKFFTAFKRYIGIIQEANDKAVEDKFFERRPVPQFASIVTQARRVLENDIRSFTSSDSPHLRRIFEYFERPQTRNGQEFWISFAQMAFERRIAVERRTDQMTARQYTDAREAVESLIRAGIPNDQTYSRRASLRALHFAASFPGMKVEEELRYVTNRNRLLQETDRAVVHQERWTAAFNFLNEVNPELTAQLPASLGPEFHRLFQRGAIDPEAIFSNLREYLGAQVEEALFLRMIDEEPKKFAEVFWARRGEFFDVLQREVILDDLFEGGPYHADGRIKSYQEIGALREDKKELARQFVREFFAKRRERFRELFLTASANVSHVIKSRVLIQRLEAANPFVGLPYQAPAQPLEQAAPTSSTPTEKTIFSASMLENFNRAFVSYDSEMARGQTARRDAYIAWIRERLDQFSTPWFKDQPLYDPPYRSRSFSSPNPEADARGLFPWAQVRLLRDLISNSEQYRRGNARFTGAELLLRSDHLYGSYYQDFASRLAGTGHFVPEFNGRVGGRDLQEVYLNALQIIEKLNAIYEIPANSDGKVFSSAELTSYLNELTNRVLNNESPMRPANIGPQGTHLLVSSGEITRDRALNILVRDKVEGLFNRVARSSSDWYTEAANGQEFQLIVDWALKDLTERTWTGDLVDPNRIDTNLLTQVGDENGQVSWSDEDLKFILLSAGIADADQEISDRRAGWVRDLQKIREIIRWAHPYAESQSARKQLENIRELYMESAEALQRNLVYSRAFSLEVQETEKSRHLVEVLGDMARLQEMTQIPMDRWIAGMEMVSAEMAQPAVIAARERLERAERRNQWWVEKIGSGVGEFFVYIGEGVLNMVAETGVWLVESPRVLAASSWMNDEQMYRYLQDISNEKQPTYLDRFTGLHNFMARRSGWRDEYIQAEDIGPWLAHQFVNAATVVTLGNAWAGRPLVQMGQRITAEQASRGVAGAAVRSAAGQVTESELLASAAQTTRLLGGSGRMRSLLSSVQEGGEAAWRVANRPTYLFRKPPDYVREPIRQVLTQEFRDPSRLSVDGFNVYRWTGRAARNTLSFGSTALVQTAPFMILPFALYGTAPSEMRADFIGESMEQAGRGLGVIPFMMLMHGGLSRISMMGGAWRYAAYANHLSSKAILAYILRETGRGGVQQFAIWGNRMDLWGDDYAYEGADFENGFPVVDPEDSSTQRALSQFDQHQANQLNFFFHMAIVGWMAGPPRVAERFAAQAERAGEFHRAHIIRNLFGSSPDAVTDDALVDIVFRRYIEGYQTELRASPSSRTPEQAAQSARDVATNRMTRIRDAILDHQNLEKMLSSVRGDLMTLGRDLGREAVRGLGGNPIRGGAPADEVAALRARFERIFEQGMQRGEDWLIGERRRIDAYAAYQKSNGQFDVERFNRERGIEEWMRQMNEKYGEGRYEDWARLSPEEKARELQRMDQIADDPVTQAYLNVLLRGGSREGDLRLNILERRVRDYEEGHPVDVGESGRLTMAFSPSLEALSRFQARITSFESGVLELPNGALARSFANETLREPVMDAQGYVRWSFLDNQGREIAGPDGRVYLHRRMNAEAGNSVLDAHFYRLNFRYSDNAWRSHLSPDNGEILLVRQSAVSQESVSIQRNGLENREPLIVIRRQEANGQIREYNLDLRANRDSAIRMLSELGIELRSQSLNERGFAVREALTSERIEGRTRREYLDDEGEVLTTRQDAQGTAEEYAVAWRPDNPQNTKVLTVRSLSHGFEFRDADFHQIIEPNRTIVFETQVKEGRHQGQQAEIRISPRSDVYEGSVNIRIAGRDYSYNTIHDAKNFLQELGIRTWRISSPDQPLNPANGALIQDQVYGLVAGARRLHQEIPGDYSVQYYKIRYGRLGEVVEGWVKTENIGGTLVTTYPDGSQTYRIWIRPDSQPMPTTFVVNEPMAQRRLLEGVTREEISDPQSLAMPLATQQASGQLRVDFHQGNRVDPERGMEFVLRLPPLAEGEVRFVMPMGSQARGQVRLVDSNGIETIIDPMTQFVRFRFAGSERDILGPVSIRDFADNMRWLARTGQSPSEGYLGAVLSDYQARAQAFQLGNYSIPKIEPRRANYFQLKERLSALGIPETSGFPTKPLAEQVRILDQSLQTRVRELEALPESYVRNMAIHEARQAYTDLQTYIKWLHSSPRHRWAQIPEERPSSSGSGWGERFRGIRDWYRGD